MLFRSDFVKFYHANFLDALEEREIDYKLLTPITKKSKYIFENTDQTKIKQLCSSVKENLCFLIKDDDDRISLYEFCEKDRKRITINGAGRISENWDYLMI